MGDGNSEFSGEDLEDVIKPQKPDLGTNIPPTQRIALGEKEGHQVVADLVRQAREKYGADLPGTDGEIASNMMSGYYQQVPEHPIGPATPPEDESPTPTNSVREPGEAIGASTASPEDQAARLKELQERASTSDFSAEHPQGPDSASGASPESHVPEEAVVNVLRLTPGLTSRELRSSIRETISLMEHSGTINSAAFLNDLQSELSSYNTLPLADRASIFHEAEVKMHLIDLNGAVATVDYKSFGEKTLDNGDLTYLWRDGQYEYASDLRFVVREMEQNDGAYFRAGNLLGTAARDNIDHYFATLTPPPGPPPLTPVQLAEWHAALPARREEVIDMSLKLFTITQRASEFLGAVDGAGNLIDLQQVRVAINGIPGLGPRTNDNRDAWDMAYYTELKRRRVADEQAGIPVTWAATANHAHPPAAPPGTPPDHPSLAPTTLMRGAIYTPELLRTFGPSVGATQLCHATESYVRSAVSDTNSDSLFNFMDRSTGVIGGPLAIDQRIVRNWQKSLAATGETLRPKIMDLLKMPVSTDLKDPTKPLMEAIGALGHLYGNKSERLSRFAAAELATDVMAYNQNRNPDSEARRLFRQMPSFKDEQVNNLFSSLKNANLIDQADKDRSLGRLHSGDGRVYYRIIGKAIFFTIWETLKAFFKQVTAK